MHERNVALLDLAAGKLLGQLAVCDVVLGDDNQAAGFLVQTVHDAGTHLAAYFRELAESMQQRIDQRAAIALVVGGARAGVDHHSRRLVDDREVGVFIDDVERNVLRDGAQRRRQGRR